MTWRLTHGNKVYFVLVRKTISRFNSKMGSRDSIIQPCFAKLNFAELRLAFNSLLVRSTIMPSTQFSHQCDWPTSSVCEHHPAEL